MSSLSLLCLLCATFALSVQAASIVREKRYPQPEVFKIPLRHQSSTRDTWSQQSKRVKRDSLLATANDLSSQPVPSQHHGLSSDNDFYYYGVATIGTPPQEFRMYLDTGSADIWVPASTCDTPFCAAPGRNRFNESASRTLHKTAYNFDITYCDNTSASGITAFDFVSMAGLTVYPQAFGIMKNVDDTSSAKLNKYDGIFGLSYPQHANPGTVPFFLNLMLRNAIPMPVFSFWLNRDPETSQQKGGELTLGGVNPDHFVEPLQYFPVLASGSWELGLDAVTAELKDGTVLDMGAECGDRCSAIIDTGTAYVVGPGIAALLESLEEAKIIQASRDYTNIIECSRVEELPTLVFQFDSEMMRLEPIHYTFPIESINGSCFRAVALDNATCAADKYILGDSFLGKYYSVYDMGKNRIGFALSQKGPEKEAEKEAEKKVENASLKEAKAPTFPTAEFATGASENTKSNMLTIGLFIALATTLFNVHS